MNKESWRELYEKFQTPLEKLQFLNGLSELSWDDCQDAWFESNKLMPQIAAHLSAAEKERDELKIELEKERMRLAGAGVAAMLNTEDAKVNRIGRDSPYWSASYGDVCDAVDREISLRKKLAVAVTCLEKIGAEISSHTPQPDRYSMREWAREALKAINGGE